MWNADFSGQVYRTYIADLIRTGGVQLRTSPYIIYRAAVLMQRFEAAVDRLYRSQYQTGSTSSSTYTLQGKGGKSNDVDTFDIIRRLAQINSLDLRRYEVKDSGKKKFVFTSYAEPSSETDVVARELSELYRGDVIGKGPVEYVVPRHVDMKMQSGIAPLADLCAPLDLCISKYMQQDDVCYLAAACLFIASKLSNQLIDKKLLVTVFMQLSLRRCNAVKVEMTNERYTDFEACVLEAEEVVLHLLGFQTAVESPFTFLHVYLNVLLDSPGPKNPTAAAWLSEAVRWVNDVPRCGPLALRYSASVLAVAALSATKPKAVRLPEKWTTAFGVQPETVHTIVDSVSNHLYFALSSAQLLRCITLIMPRPTYETTAQREARRARRELAEQEKKEILEIAAAVLAQSSQPPPQPQPQPVGESEKPKQQEPLPPPLPSPVPPPPQQPPQAAAPPPDPEPVVVHYEDISEVMRRRKQEKQEEEERRRKERKEKREREEESSRGDSKRHRHERDSDRHRHRDQDSRRRDHRHGDSDSRSRDQNHHHRSSSSHSSKKKK